MCSCRSALQISMSENLQSKPDQLISAPAKPHEMDDMFAGLGLGSYVQSKSLSLEEKGRMIQQSEQMQRMNQQPKMQPSYQVR